MSRRLAVFVFIPLIGMMLFRVSSTDWDMRNHTTVDEAVAAPSTATPELVPTDTAVILVGPTMTPDRTLPPIGANAGLVLGASVLVLIIIGGVVFTSRRRLKH